MGHVPKPGEFIERDGIRVEVLASDDLRVEQVRMAPASREAAPAAEAEEPEQS
jgi:CBS domain containing-hemolysin-like protein